MDFITFLVLTAVCLALPPTRPYGLIGLALLCLAYPFFLIGIGVTSLITYYLYIRYQRRQHDVSRLPERRP